MAKAKICPICGKEYHTAFFGNEESGCLAFGTLTLAREECYNISCCAACAQRFEALAKVADGKATKIIIPSELQNLTGFATALAETAKTDK